MADFDTAAKRFSGMGLELGEAPLLPAPSGDFNAADRQHFLDAYSGIAFGVSTFTGPSAGSVQRAAWQEASWQTETVVSSYWAFKRFTDRLFGYRKILSGGLS